MKATLTLFKLSMQRRQPFPMIVCMQNYSAMNQYIAIRNFSNDYSNIASEGDKTKFEEIKKRQQRRQS